MSLMAIIIITLVFTILAIMISKFFGLDKEECVAVGLVCIFWPITFPVIVPALIVYLLVKFIYFITNLKNK